MVVWFSAVELSIVSPPDCACFCFSGSLVVRSGLIRSHVSPRSRVRYRYCAPRYNVPGTVALTWSGVFQLKRSLGSPSAA